MDIKTYIDDYANWLKNEITFSKIGEYYEINTPFLDTDNDYLQFYVKQDGNDIYFTDDGYTINSLESSGVKMTKLRKQQLICILNQYGVVLKGNELTIKAPAKDFAQKKHAFTQCLIRVSDLYMLSNARVTSIFLDDVLGFFERRNIFPTENVQFAGISGFYHNYDFVLQRTINNPERICLAVNNANRTAIGNIIFSWSDTKPSRKDKDSKLIVLLNDNNPIGKGSEDALENYGILGMRWSKHDTKENLKILTA